MRELGLVWLVIVAAKLSVIAAANGMEHAVESEWVQREATVQLEIDAAVEAHKKGR